MLFTQYQYIATFFTFFLLWFSVQFTPEVENIVAYFLVISIGIIHGSNDIEILLKTSFWSSSKKLSLLVYIGVVGVSALFYYLFPLVAIVLFILVSAYHFGEQHFDARIETHSLHKSLLFVTYGLLIFSSLFLNNYDFVNTIITEIIEKEFPKAFYLVVFGISALSWLVIMLYLFWKQKIPQSTLAKEVFYLVLLFLVFKTASLILGFAIYFILWHSIPSILEQTQFISGTINTKEVLLYFKNAMVYWLLSIVGLLTCYYFFENEKLVTTILFSVLFAVTIPHVWVIFRMKSTSDAI